jgi:tRNA nucleotidyltransferase (CCA-adding enzyme)
MPGSPKRPARRTLRYAALLAGLSARDAGIVLTGLRSSRLEIQIVVSLLEHWHALRTEMVSALQATTPPADADVRRWVARVGRLQVGSFMRLATALWDAERAVGVLAPAASAVRLVYRRMLRSAFRDAIDLGSLAVDGDDLRRAGIPAGPALGKILQVLLAEVIEDPSRNATDWLLQEAQRLRTGS